MILELACSIMIGLALPTIYNMYVRKSVVVKRYHVHHTTHGVVTMTGSLPFLLRDAVIGNYLFGFGVGLFCHHLISEKHLKFVEKSDSRKRDLVHMEKY